MQETQVRSLSREDPLRRAGQAIPVSLPGKSHGQKPWGFCSPWLCKELDTTEWLTYTQWLMTGFPSGSVVKNPPANAGNVGFPPWVGKIPWRKKWQPTGGFLPGKSHGQRNLAGCSLWGYKRDGQDLATKQPWLMMLYIFSCAIGHLYIFLGEISKSFAHFLLGLLFFLLCIA